MEVQRELRVAPISELSSSSVRRDRSFFDRLKEFLGIVSWDEALAEW
jgi:hypothetical protein